MPQVTPSEFKVLAFVFDRTIGWGKQSERITLKHFVRGVMSRGKSYSNGTGLARRTIITALGRLTGEQYRDEHGFTPLVKTASPGRSTSYSMELRWSGPRPVSSKQNGGAKIAPEGCIDCTENGAKAAHQRVRGLHPKMIKKEGQREDEEHQMENSSSEPFSGGRQASSRKEPIHVLNALWKDSMRSEFPNTPIWDWTAKERGMVATMRKKWEGEGNARSSFGNFLVWCIKEWGAMMMVVYPSEKCRRLKAPPAPVLPFLVKAVRTFVEEYHGTAVAAIKKESSAENIARRQRDLVKLKETHSALESRTILAKENLNNINRAVNLARHGLGPLHERNLLSTSELGFEPKVANLGPYIKRFDIRER